MRLKYLLLISAICASSIAVTINSGSASKSSSNTQPPGVSDTRPLDVSDFTPANKTMVGELHANRKAIESSAKAIGSSMNQTRNMVNKQLKESGDRLAADEATKFVGGRNGLYGSREERPLYKIIKMYKRGSAGKKDSVDVTFKFFDSHGREKSSTTITDITGVCPNSSFVKANAVERKEHARDWTIIKKHEGTCVYPYYKGNIQYYHNAYRFPLIDGPHFRAYASKNWHNMPEQYSMDWVNKAAVDLEKIGGICNVLAELAKDKAATCLSYGGRYRFISHDSEHRNYLNHLLLRCVAELEGVVRWQLAFDESSLRVSEEPFVDEDFYAKHSKLATKDGSEFRARLHSSWANEAGCKSISDKYTRHTEVAGQKYKTLSEREIFEAFNRDIMASLTHKGITKTTIDGFELGDEHKIDDSANTHTFTVYAVFSDEGNDALPKVNFNELTGLSEKDSEKDRKGSANELAATGAFDRDMISKGGDMMLQSTIVLERLADKKRKEDKELRETESKFATSTLKAEKEMQQLYEEPLVKYEKQVVGGLKPKIKNGNIEYQTHLQDLDEVLEQSERGDLAVLHHSKRSKTAHESVSNPQLASIADIKNDLFGAKSNMSTLHVEPRFCLVGKRLYDATLDEFGRTKSEAQDEEKKKNSKSSSGLTLSSGQTELTPRECSVVTKKSATGKIQVSEYICEIDKNEGEYVGSGVEGHNDAQDPSNPCRTHSELSSKGLGTLAIASRFAGEFAKGIKEVAADMDSPEMDIEGIKKQIKLFKGKIYRLQDKIRQKSAWIHGNEEICCMLNYGTITPTMSSNSFNGDKYNPAKVLIDRKLPINAQKKGAELFKSAFDLYDRWKIVHDGLTKYCLDKGKIAPSELVKKHFGLIKNEIEKNGACDLVVLDTTINKALDDAIKQFCDNSKDDLKLAELECDEVFRRSKDLWNLKRGLYFANPKAEGAIYGYNSKWNDDVCNKFRGKGCSHNQCDIGWAYNLSEGSRADISSTDFKLILKNVIDIGAGILTGGFTGIVGRLGHRNLPNVDGCVQRKDYIDFAKKQVKGGCHFIGTEADIPKKPTGIKAIVKWPIYINTRAFFVRKYCCYDDELSKLIQETAAKQLGKDPASLCEGLTIEEMNAVDLSEIDSARMNQALGISPALLQSKIDKSLTKADLRIYDENGKQIDAKARSVLDGKIKNADVVLANPADTITYDASGEIDESGRISSRHFDVKKYWIDVHGYEQNDVCFIDQQEKKALTDDKEFTHEYEKFTNEYKSLARCKIEKSIRLKARKDEEDKDPANRCYGAFPQICREAYVYTSEERDADARELDNQVYKDALYIKERMAELCGVKSSDTNEILGACSKLKPERLKEIAAAYPASKIGQKGHGFYILYHEEEAVETIGFKRNYDPVFKTNRGGGVTLSEVGQKFPKQIANSLDKQNARNMRNKDTYSSPITSKETLLQKLNEVFKANAAIHSAASKSNTNIFAMPNPSLTEERYMALHNEISAEPTNARMREIDRELDAYADALKERDGLLKGDQSTYFNHLMKNIKR